MRYLILALAALTFLTIASCNNKEDDAPSNIPSKPDSTGLPFGHTEYAGVSTELSELWPKPICIDFNADSTIDVFSVFNLQVNGQLYAPDTLKGKITRWTRLPDSSISATAYYPAIADSQDYTFPASIATVGGGSRTVNGVLASNQFTLSSLPRILPYPFPGIANTWTTPVSNGADVTNRAQFYPDVANITFDSTRGSYYRRNGSLVMKGPTFDSVLYMPYHQYGARIYLYGYNEQNGRYIPYFGVLSPDGSTIKVDTYDLIDSRLPNYQQTIDWYGVPGETPVMYLAGKP